MASEKYYSKTTAAFTMNETISRYLNKKSSMLQAAFLGLKKKLTFGKVYYIILFNKLGEINIPDCLII